MKTRDEILQDVLNVTNNNILMELPTGTGKSYMALNKIKQLKPKSILIVIPRLVLIQNWKDEFIKWGCKQYLSYTYFVTYVSLPKLANNSYDLVVLDETHHLSERCRLAIPYIKSKYNILLSATVKRTLKPELRRLFPNLYEYSVSLKEAVENKILPEPRIILIPLNLEATRYTEELVYKPKAKEIKALYYNQWIKGKWQYLKGNYSYGVKVLCTQEQKNRELDEFIANCSKRIKNGNVAGLQKVFVEQARKRKGLERLQWLAEIKSDFVKSMLQQLKNYRTLTFCYNTKQADYLCKNSIHSKNSKSKDILNKFNNKKIKHITAIDCLTEGVNLADCKVLIFAKLDASLIKQTQKQGRGLRHKKPIFMLPYYKDSHEEQIVLEMIKDYNSSLITVATKPFNFNAYINR